MPCYGFKEELGAQLRVAAEQKEEAVVAAQAEVEMEQEQLARERQEAQAAAMQTAERIIEQVEASCRVELNVMQEQQMSSLQALQHQLREQLVGERQAMDVELEGRAKLLSAQMGQLKQTHAQAMADMKASMGAAIEEYEQSSVQAQSAAREEMTQAPA